MEIYQVDAFTNKAFSGNPAAVCLLDGPAEESWMQQVAAEMNLSETAFLHTEGSGYRLRWFTPTSEVKLCGHATLASAHVLFEKNLEPSDKELEFHTLSGILRARKQGAWIEMDFPGIETRSKEITDLHKKLFSVGIESVCENEQGYLIVEVPDEQSVTTIKPDFQEVLKLGNYLIMVTAPASADSPYDFASRVFAPAFGINEDPVTGSAHCALALYWKERLKKDSLTAFQASARGGVLKLRVTGNGIILGGQAVTVMEGDLRA